MAKELIISSNAHEKKIAIIENGLVTEFYVERSDENQGIVGNIYKGRVMKVLPGMQSAFVDIGLERDAFLYVTDFIAEDEDIDTDEEDARDPRGERPEQDRRDRGRQFDRDRQREQRPPQRGGNGPGQFGNRGPTPTPTPAELDNVPDFEAALRLEAEEDRIVDEFEESGITTADIEEANIEAFIASPTPEERDEFLEKITDDDIEPFIELIEEEIIEPAAAPIGRRSRRRGRQEETPAPDIEPIADEEIVEAVEVRGIEEEIVPEEEAEAPARKGRRAKAEPRGRNNSRRKPAGRAEPESAEAEEAVPVVKVGSYLAMLNEAGESLERVSDDDVPQSERPASAQASHHEEEVIEVKRPFEPAPDVPVGSIAITHDPSLERVVDESESAGSTAMSSIRNLLGEVVEAFNLSGSGEGEQPESHAAPSSHEYDHEHTHADHEGRAHSDSDSSAHTHSESEMEARAANPESVTGEAVDELAIDRDAALRGPSHHEQFARRGGRRSRPPVGGGGPGGDRRRPAGPPGNGSDGRPPRSGREDGPPMESSEPKEMRSGPPTISDLLREGQEIIVQIAKEPIASKGARITSHVALPGRFLVYMPTVDHVGVSRKIPSDEERLRLKRIMQTLKRDEISTGGFIVRTAGEGHTEEEIRDDMRYLIRTWAEIKKTADRSKSPAVVHRDLDLVQRLLRDQLSSDFSAIRVDSELEYARIVDFVNRVQPKLVRRVKLHTRATPIFEESGVQEEVDKALKPRVWLKSGGYIVINQTEALVAIDVNTGKFVGKSNRLEDTIVKTNLDAVKEIVRQIRLRDLGGIIILDFIDMEERKNRNRVMDSLQEELKQDRSPSKILQFNEFGLVAITRKRVRQSLERTLCSPCPYCTGSGLVKSAQTVCYDILAEAKRFAAEVEPVSDVILRVNPEVAKALRSEEAQVFREIEDYIGVPITIKSDTGIHQEQFDFAMV